MMSVDEQTRQIRKLMASGEFCALAHCLHRRTDEILLKPITWARFNRELKVLNGLLAYQARRVLLYQARYGILRDMRI